MDADAFESDAPVQIERMLMKPSDMDPAVVTRTTTKFRPQGGATYGENARTIQFRMSSSDYASLSFEVVGNGSCRVCHADGGHAGFLIPADLLPVLLKDEYKIVIQRAVLRLRPEPLELLTDPVEKFHKGKEPFHVFGPVDEVAWMRVT